MAYPLRGLIIKKYVSWGVRVHPYTPSQGVHPRRESRQDRKEDPMTTTTRKGTDPIGPLPVLDHPRCCAVAWVDLDGDGTFEPCHEAHCRNGVA